MTFPCYPKYKASGFLWLGDVPEHWTLKRLGHYFEERRERASDTEFEPLSVTKNGIVPRLESAAKTQDGDNRKKVLAGDFVINSRSDRKGSSGLSPLDGSVSLICTVLIPAGLHGPYIHHLFRSELFQEEYYRWGKGIVADLWSTNFSDMKNIVLGVPSEEEQTQIARFLDHETARIGALIEEQQRLIELLKEKRQAVISHAVTKGLDPTVPMKDSGVEWLGEVPAHWVCKSYRYASIIYRGKFSHRPRNDPSLYDGDFAFIQTGDIARAEKYIVEYKQTLNEKGASVSQKFPSGTLVMAIAANVGDTAILGFEAYAPDSVVGFKPERDIELEFLRFSLMAALQELKKTSTQSTQANLNIDRISGIKSVFPPLAEQSAITVYLNEVMERFSLLEKQAEASIELMNERRSALISAAVTGKIDVRGWQPPASTQAPEPAVAEAD